jgi:uncharacterized FlaG/YvyC family protein
MRLQSEHQGWYLYKRDSTRKTSACVQSNAGKLIQFAQLSRDTAATLQIEKSLHETSLRINKMQEAARLQLGLRLHDSLGRSLVLINSNGTASAPSLDEHVRQIRTHIGLVYPANTTMANLELKSAPPSSRPIPIASD